ncbi:hypothetical protein RCS94_04470 [Orbaceae bacterium ac157xtp]
MKTRIIGLTCFILSCFVIAPNHTRELTFIEKDYNRDDVQGLKDVNDKAIEFINEYNKTHSTYWKSLEPDARILVSRCVVPLQAQWAKNEPPRYHLDNSIFFIKIICSKTTDKSKGGNQWTIYVRTTKPRTGVLKW